MSIATAITDLSGRIQDAFDAISAMGGTMPATKDSYHLSTAIESIPTGGTPTYGIDGLGIFGQLSNGQMVVPTEMQELVLSGLTTIEQQYNSPFYFMGFSKGSISSVAINDLTSAPIGSFSNFGLYSNIKKVTFNSLQTVIGGSSQSQGAFYNAFQHAKIEEMRFPSLTTVGNYGFYGCCHYVSDTLRIIDFSNLQTVGKNAMYYMFSGTTANTNLTSLSFPELTSVDEYGLRESFINFQLRSISFPKLRTVGIGAFYGAMGIGSPTNKVDSIEFPEITSIPNLCFALYSGKGNKYVHNVYFPKATSIVASNYTLNSFAAGTTSSDPVHIYLPKCTSITYGYLFTQDQYVALHFASANRSAIEASAGYATKWNANTDSQILFDL